jgi:hypothetical protein
LVCEHVVDTLRVYFTEACRDFDGSVPNMSLFADVIGAHCYAGRLAMAGDRYRREWYKFWYSAALERIVRSLCEYFPPMLLVCRVVVRYAERVEFAWCFASSLACRHEQR